MANCTECDGSGYYGEWSRPQHCLYCATGRAKLLRAYDHWPPERGITHAEQSALAIARAEASISVDTVSKRD